MDPSSSPPPPSSPPFHGTLYKKRDHFSTYRPRLFVLDDTLLHYYYAANDPSPAKSIYLHGTTIKDEGERMVEGRNMRGIQVSHRATSKVYNLAAEDTEEAEMWLEKLQKASLKNGGLPSTTPPLDEETSFNSGNSQPLPPTPMSRSPTPSFPPDVAAGSTNPAPDNAPSTPLPPRYQDVPSPYPALLEESFKDIASLTSTPLPAAEGQTTGPWKFLFSKKGVLAATKSGPNVTVRGDSTMPYPPLAVLNTVINVYKKSLYDNQFDVGKRLVTYNHHTFVDYLRFKAVWPTSTRDLCNIVTWKASGGKITLVAKAFKDPSICPLVKGNVRAEALTAGWVISEVKMPDGSRGSAVNIVVCSDLKGSLPSNIKSLVTAQQAMFPVIIGRWMRDNENTEDRRFDVRVDERNVIEGVIKKLPKDLRAKSSSDEGSIAVTHIALKALALTLREMPTFNGRRVNLPLIGVSGWYPNAGIDVSTTAGRPENGVRGIVKLRDADGMGVAEISREITKRATRGDGGGWGGDAAVPGFLKRPMEVLSEQLDLPVKGLGLEGRKFGSALVITSPNNDGSEVDISVSPMNKSRASGSGPNVILVVGGVQILPSFSKEPRSAIARPVLSISVTFDVEVANVMTCRMFAEKLQNRMRNPELLDVD
ncbi:hypothetical protein TrRE_jg12985 [Triparma retinervis]|uniref:PH domain-containing protein n=1 Tax=Triparma retinervis TaxID=2557542 RepID=A0A9W7DS14_9STRA|nr:hypothetical protein TrRE_jg12985 [Triparma retinervis]